MAYVLFSKLLQIMVKTTIMGKPKGTSCIHSREMTQESHMFLLLADWPSGSFLCTKLQHSHPFAYCARPESVPRTRTALFCVRWGLVTFIPLRTAFLDWSRKSIPRVPPSHKLISEEGETGCVTTDSQWPLAHAFPLPPPRF